MRTMLIAALTACCTTTALAQEHMRSQGGTAPADAKLVTENELVQVFRMSVPARATTPMHDISPRVVVWLSDAHFVDRLPNGDSREEQRRAGDVEWVPARRHAGENLADTPMEFIAVVPKERHGGGGAH